MYRIWSILVALILLSVPVHAENGLTVHWGLIDLPPVSIQKGPDAGKGIIDIQTDLFIKSLPQYKHNKISVSLPRLMQEIRSGKPFCFAALTRTEKREKFVDYAPQSMILLPNGLITSMKSAQKLKPFLNESGAVYLDRLLSKSDFQLNISSERSYAPTIDETLKKHREANNGHITVRKGLPRLKLQIKQVANNRVDGFLGRPTEVFYTALQSGQQQQIYYHPIVGAEEFVAVQVGCAKGEWNQQFMKDLTKATYALRKSDEFIKPSLHWLPPNYTESYLRTVRSGFKD